MKEDNNVIDNEGFFTGDDQFYIDNLGVNWHPGDLRYTRVRDVKKPERGTPGSAGIDLFIPNKYDSVVVEPGEGTNIASGIKFRIPQGFALIALNKSGLSMWRQLQVGAQVIDSDYTGEVHINLINNSDETQTFSPGDKVVQVLLMPVAHCGLAELETEEELYANFETERGEGAFGSTGDK